jgi:serine/threonine protein phosphatase 1
MEKNNKIWCISDIHGCYDEMMALYKQLLKNGANPEKDIFIFLGDYIDRGPDSKKVVGQLVKWHKKYPHWVFLFGNHEDLFLDWIATSERRYGSNLWFVNGGKETFKNYGGHFGKQVGDDWEAPKMAKFPKSHLDFLFKETVHLAEFDDYVFVHGGLIPEVSIEECKNYVKTIIWARYEFINSDYNWGKLVIFGHTADYNSTYNSEPFMPIVMKNKIGIDTAICPPASKRLTALELPAKKFYFQESLKIYKDIEKLMNV